MPGPMMPPVTAAPGGMPPKPMTPGPGNTSPAAVPTNNMGTKARGVEMLKIISKALVEAIKLLDPTSAEGQAAIGALKTLAKYGSSGGPDMSKQELGLLGNRTQGPPNAGDIQQKMAGLGLGGGTTAPSPASPAAMPGGA